MAQTAKTVVSTVNHGTLSTLTPEGIPLGTYVAYVLDPRGSPLLRLRSDAVHRRNLEISPQCSLFVQAPKEPARNLARVTMIGSVSFVEDEDSLMEARERYKESHADASGLDALRAEDQFGLLHVDKVFYVGGLDGNRKAEEVDGDAFLEIAPDPLRLVAPDIVHQWNNLRMEDIYRICRKETGISLMEMVHAELSWVDRFGFYVTYDTIEKKGNVLRVAFPREVEEDRDARSLLTMAAHLAWESERNALPTL